MNCSFSPPVRAALLGAALVGLTSTAASPASVHSGVLECNVEAGAGFIIGSSKNLSCVFRPARGRPEYYAGTINRIGLDIGVTGPARLFGTSLSRGLPAAAMRLPANMPARALDLRWALASAPIRSSVAMPIR